MLLGQVIEPHAADERCQIGAHDARVPLVTAWPQLDARHLGQPAFQQLPDREARIIDDAEPGLAESTWSNMTRSPQWRARPTRMAPRI